MPSRLEWYGEDIKRELRSAAREGMDELTEAVAEAARRDHPQWQSRTGEAEESLISVPAQDTADGVVGAAGFDIERGYFLEVTTRGHPGDRTVERAMERLGDSLSDRIARRFGS